MKKYVFSFKTQEFHNNKRHIKKLWGAEYREWLYKQSPDDVTTCSELLCSRTMPIIIQKRVLEPAFKKKDKCVLNLHKAKRRCWNLYLAYILWIYVSIWHCLFQQFKMNDNLEQCNLNFILKTDTM